MRYRGGAYLWSCMKCHSPACSVNAIAKRPRTLKTYKMLPVAKETKQYYEQHKQYAPFNNAIYSGL